ncbi:MAG: hypothetical protein ACRDIB_10845, partial [Ardenticatenaceae bacterium]
MQLVKERLPLRDDLAEWTLLQFAFAPVPEQAGHALQFVHFGSDTPGWAGGQSGYSRTHGIEAGLELDAGENTPAGRVHVQVTGASIVVRGPWVVRWEVPGSEQSMAPAQPVRLQPLTACATRNNVTLRVEEAVMSDRVTQLRVGAEEMPDGMSFARVLTTDPATLSRASGLYLSDNLSGRYDFSWNMHWHPPADAVLAALPGLDEATLTFPAVNPLVRRVTLHVPSIEATVHDQVEFNVDVPAEIAFSPAEHGQMVSAPWPVDIPLDVGGFSFRFTQARLHQNGSTVLLELISETAPGGGITIASRVWRSSRSPHQAGAP